MNRWFCYLLVFDNSLGSSHDFTGSFRFSLEFNYFRMEKGHDFVNVYVNSLLITSITGKGELSSSSELSNEHSGSSGKLPIYHITKDVLLDLDGSFEVCYNVITDESVVHTGFTSIFKLEYENPQVVEWTKWSDCLTQTPIKINAERWDGSCGIGVREREITKCLDNPAVRTPFSFLFCVGCTVT